jgi:hypothetical protein
MFFLYQHVLQNTTLIDTFFVAKYILDVVKIHIYETTF